MAELSQTTKVRIDHGYEDAVLVWGLMVWFLGAVCFTKFLWHHLSFRDFLLAWLACAFVALVYVLVDLIRHANGRFRAKKLNTLWKASIILRIVFSLTGPVAFVATVIWMSLDLLKAMRWAIAHIAERA